MEKIKRLCVCLPEKDVEKLKKIAQGEYKTVSAKLRQWVVEYKEVK